ncbi:putative 8-amino-7-oxononanoate synthase 2 [subsurface metagenome]
MTDIFEKCYNFKRAAEARKNGIYPFFRPLQESRGSRVIIEGRTLIMAGSNNYLGLAQDPWVEEAAVKAIEKYGTSCSGSRFINGSLVLHEELEAKLAAFLWEKRHPSVFPQAIRLTWGLFRRL